MTRMVATVALVAAVAAFGTPSFAQTNTGSPSVTAPTHKASVQHARPLYNMAPGSAPVNGRDDPAFTGGGSLGYNQMIYNW